MYRFRLFLLVAVLLGLTIPATAAEAPKKYAYYAIPLDQFAKSVTIPKDLSDDVKKNLGVVLLNDQNEALEDILSATQHTYTRLLCKQPGVEVYLYNYSNFVANEDLAAEKKSLLTQELYKKTNIITTGRRFSDLWMVVLAVPADTKKVDGILQVGPLRYYRYSAKRSDWQGVQMQFSLPLLAQEKKSVDLLASAALFFAVKSENMRMKQEATVAGAWYRYQADYAQKQYDKLVATEKDSPAFKRFEQRFLRSIRNRFGLPPRWQTTGADSDFEETFRMFTGERGIVENLPLDRDLILSDTVKAKRTIDVNTLAGVKVQPYDWEKLLGDKKPQLDPLAEFIPVDQHAAFFPTFTALLEVGDKTSQQGMAIFQAMNLANRESYVAQKYRKQMCLETSLKSRLFGPQVIKSVAITGSDGFFQTGTDVAVLFETSGTSLDTVYADFVSKLETAAKAAGVTVQKEGFPIKSESISGLMLAKNTNRSLCAYLFKTDKMVVVANSLAQVQAIASVLDKKKMSLAALDEYKFFRDRYKLSEPETVFIFLSDPTIRRWCSPKALIGKSRRIRAMAELANKQVIAMNTPNQPLPIDPKYGSLFFETPIAELNIEKVTPEEKRAYQTWLRGYENLWEQFFDPIAIRVHFDEGKREGVALESLKLDVSVMPLHSESEYLDEEFLRLAMGGSFEPTDADPHKSLVQFVVAIDPNSRIFKQGDMFSRSFGENISLGWIGKWIKIYVEDNEFIHQLAKKVEEEKLSGISERYLIENINQFPLAVQIDCKSNFQLVAFLAAVRVFATQAAPDMLTWETRKHGNKSYTVVTVREDAISEKPISLFYCNVGNSLLASFYEPIITGAIDRYTVKPGDVENAAKTPAAKDLTPAELQKAKRREAAKAGLGIAATILNEVSKGAAQKGNAEAAKTTNEVAGMLGEVANTEDNVLVPVPADKPWIGKTAALRISKQSLGILNLLLDEQSDYRHSIQSQAWEVILVLNDWKRAYPAADPLQLFKKYWHADLICPAGGKYVWNEKWQTYESTALGSPWAPKFEPKNKSLLEIVNEADFGIELNESALRARAEIEMKKQDTKSIWDVFTN